MTKNLQFWESNPRLYLTVVQSQPWTEGHRSGLHEHPFFEFAVVLDGTCNWRLGRQTVRVHSGEWLLLPPHRKHGEEIAPGGKARMAWLGFNFAREQEPAGLRNICEQPMTGGIWHEDMKHLCESIYRESQQPTLLGSEARVGLTLRSILLLLARVMTGGVVTHAAPPPPRRTQAVRAAAHTLASNLSSPLRITALARYHGLGAGRFATRFREEHGESPREFRQRCRVEEACRQLSDTKLSIKEIAASCGYTDAAHFCHHFKHAKGQSPRAWRLKQSSQKLHDNIMKPAPSPSNQRKAPTS